MVLNQISASTYGQIGKSADVSKYVMGGRGRDELEEGKPTWINELEVEFREEEEREEEVRRGKRSEDFEVEFSSAAPGPRFGFFIIPESLSLDVQVPNEHGEQDQRKYFPTNWKFKNRRLCHATFKVMHKHIQ